MERLPLEVQTLHAELLERLAAYEAQRAIGHVAGTFVRKTIKGQEYYYFQHLEPGGLKRQIYLGRRDGALDAVARRYGESRRDTVTDEASIQRLCALLRAGGAMTTDAPSARVLHALADAGVFLLGGVLVGTHAYVAIGNLLGVRWSGAALGTQDVDVAASCELTVAMPNPDIDIPSLLESLEMGFLPVPGLNPNSPTTSFKVRGRGLRVDLVTPARRHGQRTMPLRRFSAAAQAFPFLDLAVEAAVRAAVTNGGGTSVSVPDPARFAFHKLILAGERPPTMHTKRDKDLLQAAQVLEVLLDERPGDIALALEAIEERGRGWTRRVVAGLSAMRSFAPEVSDRLTPSISR